MRIVSSVKGSQPIFPGALRPSGGYITTTFSYKKNYPPEHLVNQHKSRFEFQWSTSSNFGAFITCKVFPCRRSPKTPKTGDPSGRSRAAEKSPTTKHWNVTMGEGPRPNFFRGAKKYTFETTQIYPLVN